MRKFSLDAIAHQEAQRAAEASSHRSAETVVGGHENRLRHTVIAIKAGAELAEHLNPGEATVTVLHGRVQLHNESDTWEARTHDLIDVPPGRNSLRAVEDSAVLYTVVKA